MSCVTLSFLLITLIFIYATQCNLVKWVPNASFNLASNFRDKKLPCSNQTVIFPAELDSSVRIDADEAIGAIVLPTNGDIVLSENVRLSFGGNGKSDGCKGGDSYFLEKIKSSWCQPDVWSSDRFNDATPDAERVPCYYDIVEFPETGQFAIRLPDTIQYILGLRIRGHFVSQPVFRQMVIRGSYYGNYQMFAPNKYNDIGVNITRTVCPTKAGCPCQDPPPQIECAEKYCSPLECVNPIKPVGHCCNICGGSLLFETSDSFDISMFKDLIEKRIKADGGEGKFVYHVGKIGQNNVQLVVVERGPYDGSSLFAVSQINANLPSYWLAGKRSLQVSGSPSSEVGAWGRITLAVFIAVVLTVLSIFLVFYKMPAIRYPIDWTTSALRGRVRGVGRANMLSRFQRRTESVVSLTRRDSSPMSSGAGIGTSATAFRNPLYDSKRGPVTRLTDIEDTISATDDY